jgi:hypothetical protein
MAETTTQDPQLIIRETLDRVSQTLDQMTGILSAISTRLTDQDTVLLRLRALAERAEPMLAAAESNPLLRYATSRRANRG